MFVWGLIIAMTCNVIKRIRVVDDVRDNYFFTNEYESYNFFFEHVVALKRAVVENMSCKLICFSRLLREKDRLDVG